MKITVSELMPEDKAQWHGLYHEYADFYEVPMNQNILDTAWSWIFDENYPMYAMIAKDEQGKGVGFMHYHAMPSPLRGAHVSYLNDLYVVADCRSSGVVDVLFDELKKAAQERGWPFVRWVTAENNYRGRACYDEVAVKTHWQTYQIDLN